jgi:hypothetical protein
MVQKALKFICNYGHKLEKRKYGRYNNDFGLKDEKMKIHKIKKINLTAKAALSND